MANHWALNKDKGAIVTTVTIQKILTPTSNFFKLLPIVHDTQVSKNCVPLWARMSILLRSAKRSENKWEM